MDENKLLGASGAGQIVEARGNGDKIRTWHIYPPNDYCYAKHQSWLEMRARSSCAKALDEMGDKAATIMIRELTRDIAVGMYAWSRPMPGGEQNLFQRSLAGLDGLVHWLGILMGQNDTELAERLTDDFVMSLFMEKQNEFALALKAAMETVPAKKNVA